MKPISALRRAAGVLLALLSLAAPAATLSLDGSSGERPVQSLRVLVDSEGTLGLAEVKGPAADARWQRVDTGRQAANFGLTTAAVWFEIALAAGPGGEGRWLLTVAFPTLDRVDVYAGERESAPLAGGDLLPFALRATPHRHHVFPVDLAPGEAKTLYVRLQSEGNLTAPLTLWRAEALWASDHGTYAALGLYFGILAALLLYNGLMFLSLRDPLYLLYVAFVAAMGLAQLASTGLGNEFLWPGSPRWGNDAMMIGMSATGLFAVLFVRRFLAMANHSRAIDRAVLGTGVLFATALLLTVAVSYRWGAYVINVAAFSFALLAVAGGARSAWLRQPGGGYFLLAWTVLLAGTGLLAALNVGLVPSNGFTRNAFLFGSGFEMLLLSFALASRVDQLRRERERSASEALEAKQSLVISLQESERRLEERVQARTRDLQDVNARLIDRERALDHLAHHDALTGLANRRRLADTFRQAAARSRRTKTAFAVLLVDLDGFRALNDRRGHALGDRVLVAVADRLRACVREADHAARLDGDNFVVLVENLASGSDAELVAQKIVRAIEPPIAGDADILRVSASVGIACYPEHGEDPETLLRLADAAKARARQRGPGRWSLADPSKGALPESRTSPHGHASGPGLLQSAKDDD
ncbi:MAG: diguanylate cyclase [Betaproteobacteria bacterium]|nr:diguanylate cyclase [Betaproteobacteria bacterium]